MSNKIAEDLNVKHESPQIIYVKDKAQYWAASHWSVTKAHMTAVLTKFEEVRAKNLRFSRIEVYDYEDMLDSAKVFKEELYKQLSRIGKCLSSDKRLEILTLLSQGSKTMEKLAFCTHMNFANVSRIFKFY